MNIVQIDNWRDYHRDGEQFLNTANSAFTKRKKTFTPETLYNLTCMAIEKLIMAFLMKNGDLAENHTMGDLQRALQKHLGDIGELGTDLEFLDTFQEICDLDTYTINIPNQQDIVRFLRIGDNIQTLLNPYLYDKTPQVDH